MLSSIILLCCDGPQGSGFPPVEYLYTIGPGESGERGGHLCRLGSIPYTNFRELRKAEVQLPRIPLPRTSVNSAWTCSVHRTDVSHDIEEEAKIRGPKRCRRYNAFRTHQRNGAGDIGREPNHEREHERADQGAAGRRPHHVPRGPRGDTRLLRGHGGHRRGPKRRGDPQAGPRAPPEGGHHAGADAFRGG